ncbi:DUF6503 family protein [Marinoscillum furvescens]|nr:DUF6503 family protein [Marinoscillum furvescens]
MKNTLIVLLIILSFSCQQPDETGWIPQSWIAERVADSETRMQQSAAGSRLLDAINAHGGMEKWFANGALWFHFDYQPLDDKTRRNSYQLVDQWSARSVHELATNREVRYGWDGRDAWVFPDTAELPVNPRFWSMTPFYFVGLPFVLADEGTQYEQLEPQQLNGRNYDLVKVTYTSGTGDAPDDFYIIYIDQQTSKMGALRYIVTYPGFFPNGGHSPEKIMILKGLQEVDGIWLATGYDTHWWKDGVGEHITTIDVKDVQFKPSVDREEAFAKPAGARLHEGL